MNSKWRDSIDLLGLKQKSHSVVVKGTVASFPMETTEQFNTGNLICAAAVVLNLKSLHDKKKRCYSPCNCMFAIIRMVRVSFHEDSDLSDPTGITF